MNYERIYSALCVRGAQPRNLQGRVERHHITPRHVGGSNDPANLTTLTPREHLLAHRLLYRMYGRWQDRLAWNALAGFDPNARSTAQRMAGLAQAAQGKGIHSQTLAERSEFGKKLAVWNESNPTGRIRSITTRRTEVVRTKAARSKAEFLYHAPDGRVFESRREAALAFNVEAFSIENWGRRGHYGWSRSRRGTNDTA